MNHKEKRVVINASDFALTDEQLKQIVTPTILHPSKWDTGIGVGLGFEVLTRHFSQLTLSNIPMTDGTKVKQTYKLELIETEVIKEEK